MANTRRKKPTPAPSRSRRRLPAAAPALPPPPAAPQTPDDLGPAVVGVGASAGGLEAFGALLEGLPADANVAIVFVQHLAPQHPSALVELLAARTSLRVVQATEGVVVERGQVYVIPPNAQLVIADNQLHLGPRPADRSQHTPIDRFFSSLAGSVGRRCAGVILSGTGSDGAIGLSDIKAVGGLTIAQAPDSAKYDGMPRAAIATGLADIIARPEDIGRRLAQFAAAAEPEESAFATDPAITEGQLEEIFGLLRQASGVDFRQYKLPTIRRRLVRRMALQRMSDVTDYIRLLQANANEVRNLYRDLLIHVTRFFREPESFEAIAREALPAILAERPRDAPIRVWVSGCATGEEAYSIAITLVEALAKQQVDHRIQIFATDVSETAIEHARAGIYSHTIEADVSADRLRRFFARHDGGYRVTKMIRDLCIFARQDLTKDPPFSRLDLILCRNVLIYMDLRLQKKLLSVFHYALNPNGFLVLGQAETVGAQATLYSLVDKKFRIHRKRPGPTPPALSFPVDHTSLHAAVKKTTADLPNVERLLQAEVNRVVNDRFAPPSVVIDADLQIVQFRGQTGTFLEPAPGQASLSLLKMAKEGLLYGLRSAIAATRKSRAPVRRTGLRVRAGRRWVHLNIEVVPLAAAGRLHYLVIFDEQASRGGAKPVAPAGDEAAVAAGKSRRLQMHSLERELAASREYLQSVIQELEAANEELQSANEEILSSNEELQSTNEELDTAKEELQSTNEELNTVNEELHGRNEELSRVNSDLINLLGSVQIAIVIVGSDMRIRRFTPMAEKVLNLIPADVERVIGHINPNIEGANLEALIAECMDTIAPIEREVRDRQGRWYALRVRPYRTADNRIDGAVLALFDIDAPKRYEASVRSASALADAVLQESTRPMCVVDSLWRVHSVNAPFLERMHLSRDGVQGKVLGSVVEMVSGHREIDALTDGPGEGAMMAVQVRPRHRKKPLTLRARIFHALDGSAGRLVLLTAGDAERAQGHAG